METQSYNIVINNQSYHIRCNDGEEHVRLIEGRLRTAFGEVAKGTGSQTLSPYALKVAIMLADQGIRDLRERERQEALFTQKLTPLLEQLDSVLPPDKKNQPGVAFSEKPI